MDLISLLVALVIVGVLLYVVSLIPMDATILRIIQIVVILVVVLWLLSALGVLNVGNIRIGR
jgi:hypothetical protein